MGEVSEKVPGKSSSAASGHATNNDQVRTPGKTTGVEYIDNGAACSNNSGSANCFLTAGQRDRLIMMFIDEVSVAQTNYKLAIEELRVDKLVEKDDDLNWVIGLVLDLATSHFSSITSKALNKMKNSAIKRAEDLGLDRIVHGDYDISTQINVKSALTLISDKTVETTAKNGFDLGKKKASGAAKAVQNAEVKEEKAETLSYLDQLKEQCDIGYQSFKQQMLAGASDAELVVLLKAMDAQHHTIGQYKLALTEKLKRFKKSGVTDIGQKAVTPTEEHTTTLYASKRCVWLRNPDGSKSLWMYHVIDSNQDDPWISGKNPDIEKVPDEFVDVAVAKSEEKWGTTPVLDNPANKMKGNS